MSITGERVPDEGAAFAGSQKGGAEGAGMPAHREQERERVRSRGGRAGPRLVLDTNVFVAAGFSARSSSARIVERVRAGAWTLVWNRETRRETEAVLARIPPLAGQSVEALFLPEAEWAAETHPERFGAVEDPDDRKFAALAADAGAVLVSNDEHLLSRRGEIGVEVLTPREVIARYEERGGAHGT